MASITSITILHKQIEILIDADLTRRVNELGLRRDPELEHLSRTMTDMLAMPVSVHCGDIVSTLLEEAIIERGSAHFRGFEDQKERVFGLMDKSPFLLGFHDGFY